MKDWKVIKLQHGGKDIIKVGDHYEIDGHPIKVDSEGNIVIPETNEKGTIDLKGVTITPQTQYNPYSFGSYIPFQYSEDYYDMYPTLTDLLTRPIRRRLARNLAPIGYDDPIKRFINAVVFNEKEPRKEEFDDQIKKGYVDQGALQQVWEEYLNIPKRERTKVNPYSELVKNKGGYYSFKYPDKVGGLIVDDDFTFDGIYGSNSDKELSKNMILGNYFRGKNNKKVYYSDSRLKSDGTVDTNTGWDINPFSNTVANEIDKNGYTSYRQNTNFLGFKALNKLLGNVGDLHLPGTHKVPIYGEVDVNEHFNIPKNENVLPEYVVYGEFPNKKGRRRFFQQGGTFGQKIGNFLNSDTGKSLINLGQQLYSGISNANNQIKQKQRLEEWKKSFIDSQGLTSAQQQQLRSQAEQIEQAKAAQTEEVTNVDNIAVNNTMKLLENPVVEQMKKQAEQYANNVILNQQLQTNNSNSGFDLSGMASSIFDIFGNGKLGGLFGKSQAVSPTTTVSVNSASNAAGSLLGKGIGSIASKYVK